MLSDGLEGRSFLCWAKAVYDRPEQGLEVLGGVEGATHGEAKVEDGLLALGAQDRATATAFVVAHHPG